MDGTVKFFKSSEGFGFITGDDKKEYFVHSSALKEKGILSQDDRVTFDAEQGDRGPKAVNVKKV